MRDRYFMIAGLPRCRSAWFANLLTFGPCFCHHDGFLGAQNIADFKRKMEGTAGMVVGNSDPANTIFWKQISGAFPDAKWIVIRRDFEETFRACQKAFPETTREALWIMADQLAELTKALNPTIVDFDTINPNIARMVARHCGVFPGSPERVEQLCRLNVQVDPKRLRQEIQELTLNQPEWFKAA